MAAVADADESETQYLTQSDDTSQPAPAESLEQDVADADIPAYANASATALTTAAPYAQFIGPTYNLYPLENYTFGRKDAKFEKDSSVRARLARQAEVYEKEGMRRVVEGILLVHNHGHPCILLLQIGNTFFKLPGGKLKPGESDIDGLKRKLNNKLADVNPEYHPAWEVGELVSVWWRPAFEPVHYPYIPPHITKPKEQRRMYIVPLPDKCYFAVPRNLKLLAVPLFELFDNPLRYGPVIATLPIALSRFKFTCT